MIKGYYITAGNKGYFMRTDSQKKTKRIIQCIIQQIAIQRGFCWDLIDRIMEDQYTCQRIRRDTIPATIEKIKTDTDTYYCITGKNIVANYSEDDFNKLIMVFA